MSSGTKSDMGGARGMLSQATPKVVTESAGPTMVLSPRQTEMDLLWRYYCCANYEGRRSDWDGKQALDKVEHESVATSGFVPPGFYDAGQTLPLKFRKPTAPYYLARVVVDRFTSLLFSARRHPRVISDDSDTEDWLVGFCEATRLWSKMLLVRTYGGAMGSVGMGFKFVSGEPVVEVHDPRWCTPEFIDRHTYVVKSLEKRYQFMDHVRDPVTGAWEEAWFWYRRVIDDQTDTVWERVPCTEHEEPRWNRLPRKAITHGYGFCPVVWLQNKPVEDSIDGDSDCHGIYDLITAIDALYAQANRGVIANSDPTLKIISDAEFDNVSKGSTNALQVEKGGDVAYMEITGTGAKSAVDLAEKLEEKALITARCFLDTNTGGPSRTASEVDHNYSNMIEQADVLREQYGEHGVKSLLKMVLKAAKGLGVTRSELQEDGTTAVVRHTVRLPKRQIVNDETGETTFVPRTMGAGEEVDLRWPSYFTPSFEAVLQAVQTAGLAKQYGLVDEEKATQYIAEYFQITNVREVVIKARLLADKMSEKFSEQAMSRAQNGGGAEAATGPASPPPPTSGPQAKAK